MLTYIQCIGIDKCYFKYLKRKLLSIRYQDLFLGAKEAGA